LRKFILFLLILLAIGAGFGYTWFQGLKVDMHARSQTACTIKIDPGMSVQKIAQILHEQGVISNPDLFRWKAYYQKIDKSLKAGEYLFDKGLTIQQTLDLLVSGKTVYQVFTVPEGLTMAQIAERVAEINLESEEFIALASDSAFVRSLGFSVRTLEGYLYPDTYYLSDEVDDELFIRRMVGEFWNQIPKNSKQRADSMGFSLHEIVTLASIIEGEAQVDSERTIISAVYHNRLRLGHKLEADPTVQYAHGTRKKRLLYKDLEIDSPYNTYLYPGLPPGPINSPGSASIRAALYPANVDYFFFVASGDGTHIFTKTATEHNRARRTVRKKR